MVGGAKNHLKSIPNGNLLASDFISIHSSRPLSGRMCTHVVRPARAEQHEVKRFLPSSLANLAKNRAEALSKDMLGKGQSQRKSARPGSHIVLAT